MFVQGLAGLSDQSGKGQAPWASLGTLGIPFFCSRTNRSGSFIRSRKARQLDPIESTLEAGELVGLYTHSFQDGEEEMGERPFMMFDVASPTRVVVNSGVILMVFVSGELEVAAVFEAKVFCRQPRGWGSSARDENYSKLTHAWRRCCRAGCRFRWVRGCL